MSEQYILKGREAVPCDDLLEWGKWFENREARKIAADTVDDVRVSTVFLGLDHAFGDGPPLLFETMVFGGPHDQWQDRYSTYDEAEAGHKRVLDAVREGQDPELTRKLSEPL